MSYHILLRCQSYKLVIKVIQSLPCLFNTRSHSLQAKFGKGSRCNNYKPHTLYSVRFFVLYFSVSYAISITTCTCSCTIALLHDDTVSTCVYAFTVACYVRVHVLPSPLIRVHVLVSMCSPSSNLCFECCRPISLRWR